MKKNMRRGTSQLGHTTKTANALRIFGWIAGGAVVLLGGIELLARADIRRNRAAREHLGEILHTEERGSGEPVVFIAGLQGSTRYWSRTIDSPPTGRRFIFVDLLGFGHSPWPADVDYTLEDQLSWLRRTLQHAQAARDVTLVGHSMGAIVAAEYAARYPEEVKRVILAGTPVFESETEARERIRAMSSLAGLFSLNPFFAREGCMTMEAFRPVLMRVLPTMMRGRRPEVIQDALLHHWPSFNGTMKHILLRTRVEPAVRLVGPRCVLIHGKRDEVTPLAEIQRLADETGAQLVVVPGGHHDYMPAIDAVIGQ